MPHQALVPAFTTPLLSLPVFVTRRFWIRCHWSRVNKKLVKKYRNPKGAATGHKASDSLPVRLVHTLDLPGCNPSTSHLDGLGGKSLPGRWFWQYICLGGQIFWKKTWRGHYFRKYVGWKIAICKMLFSSWNILGLGQSLLPFQA